MGMWASDGVGQVPSLVPASGRHAFFGGRAGEVPVRVTATNAVRGRLGHALHVQDRSILVREQEVVLEAGQTRSVVLPVDFPEVKAGVILPVDLVVTFLPASDRTAATNLRIRLWLYSTNAFAHQARMVEELKIGLFDPDGQTARRFTEAGLPFESVPRLEGLRNPNLQTLVIGEGLNLREYRGIDRLLMELAQLGKTVILLAPAQGEIGIPLTPPDAGRLPCASLMFKKREIIGDFEKRLDDETWGLNTEMVFSTMRMEGSRTGMEGHFERGANPAGWFWMDSQWENGGRWLVCGFALMSHWEAQPTPRYFWLKLLERIHAQRTADAGARDRL